MSPDPLRGLLQHESLEGMIKVDKLVRILGASPRWAELHKTIGDAVEIFVVRSDFLDEQPEPRFEELCLSLERAFQNSTSACTCCQRDLPHRCVWCADAKGWHRCQDDFIAPEGRSLTLSDSEAWRWRCGSLYDLTGNDVDRVVIEALQRATPAERILPMLANLREQGLLSEARSAALTTLVAARCGAIVDDAPAPLFANQRYVLSHSARSPDGKCGRRGGSCLEELDRSDATRLGRDISPITSLHGLRASASDAVAVPRVRAISAPVPCA